MISVSVVFPLIAQSTKDLPQYLFQEFSSGSIKKKSGTTVQMILNYNTITEKMVVSEENRFFDLTNVELIDTIIINARKFVPFRGGFYEVLLRAPFSLLIQHKSSMEPVGSPAGYGSTSQTSAIDNYVGLGSRQGTLNLKIPDQYEIKAISTYWIVNASTQTSFVNRNQFLKISTQNRKELEDFIKKNRIKFENPDDVVKLMIFYNELVW